MSIMRRPANKFAIPCAILAVLASPLGSATTVVWPGSAVDTRTVSFADLDLTNTRSIETLYGRIKTAAGKVCDSDEPTSLQTLQYVRTCTRQAIDQAVKDANSPGLATFHAAVTERTDFR
jgi:UrcA family protein